MMWRDDGPRPVDAGCWMLSWLDGCMKLREGGREGGMGGQMERQTRLYGIPPRFCGVVAVVGI